METLRSHDGREPDGFRERVGGPLELEALYKRTACTPTGMALRPQLRWPRRLTRPQPRRSTRLTPRRAARPARRRTAGPPDAATLAALLDPPAAALRR
jgi:hypothetical protein